MRATLLVQMLNSTMPYATLDVWFDSGTRTYAVLREREELQDPADLILKVQTNIVAGSNRHC